jgi:thymidine kinase
MLDLKFICPHCRQQAHVFVNGKDGKAIGHNAKLRVHHIESHSPFCSAIQNSRVGGRSKSKIV